MDDKQKNTTIVALIIVSALFFGIIGLCFSVAIYLVAKFIYDKIKPKAKKKQ